MRNLMLFELLAFVAAAPSDPSPIRLPVVQQTAPSPMPADAAITLTPDVLYVVEADVPCLTFLSPGGAVRFTKEAGPITVRGKFVGSTGTETRKFTGKHVYLFEAVREGRDELIIVPVGAVNETDARRVTFQVGTAPRPPPEPKPDPKPDPEPKPVTGKLAGWVLIEETSKPFQNRGAILTVGQQWSRDNGVNWRVADQDVRDASGAVPADLATYITRAKAKGVEQLFLVTESGGLLWEGKAPAGSAEFVELLKKYRGQ